LLLWAATIGKQSELLEAMFSGYFEHAESLFTRDDLIAVAGRVGIAANDVNTLLDSDAYEQDVVDDQQLANGLGATGVPFFVVNRTYGIAGAQPVEVFASTFERALAESAE
jgi:predicted DsbA family dithiol-disulfide isomerase